MCVPKNFSSVFFFGSNSWQILQLSSIFILLTFFLTCAFCKAPSDWLHLPLAALYINRHRVISKIRLTMPRVKISRADRNPWLAKMLEGMRQLVNVYCHSGRRKSFYQTGASLLPILYSKKQQFYILPSCTPFCVQRFPGKITQSLYARCFYFCFFQMNRIICLHLSHTSVSDS